MALWTETGKPEGSASFAKDVALRAFVESFLWARPLRGQGWGEGRLVLLLEGRNPVGGEARGGEVMEGRAGEGVLDIVNPEMTPEVARACEIFRAV